MQFNSHTVRYFYPDKYLPGSYEPIILHKINCPVECISNIMYDIVAFNTVCGLIILYTTYLSNIDSEVASKKWTPTFFRSTKVVPI